MTRDDYEGYQRETAARSYGPASLRYLMGDVPPVESSAMFPDDCDFESDGD